MRGGRSNHRGKRRPRELALSNLLIWTSPGQKCLGLFSIAERVALPPRGAWARTGASRRSPAMSNRASLKPSLASGYQHGHALAWVAARQYRCRQNAAVAAQFQSRGFGPGPPLVPGNQRTSNAVLTTDWDREPFLPFPPQAVPRRRKAKTSDPAPGFLSSWFPRGGSRELKGGGHGSRWSAALCHHSW